MGDGFDSYYREYLHDRLEAYRRGVIERILPCFENMEREAKDYAEMRYQELQNAPGIDPENVGEGELEERAFEDSVEYYIMLDWLRQQTINNATAGLYHLWEKDLKLFLQRTIVRYGSANASKVENANFPRLIKILNEHGFNFEQQPCFDRMNGLHHVANVVKHGSGKSFDKLIELRPDLFRKNEFTGLIDPDIDNLEIQEQHFGEFADTVKEFWDTFDISLKPVS